MPNEQEVVVALLAFSEVAAGIFISLSLAVSHTVRRLGINLVEENERWQATLSSRMIATCVYKFFDNKYFAGIF